MTHMCRFVLGAVLGAGMLILALFPLSSAEALQIQRVVSPGGIEAWLVEDHKIPVLAVEFQFEGGNTLDPPDRSGLAYLTASLLDEGAGDLDSQAYAKRLQDDAITVAFNASADTFEGTLKTLSQNRDAALDLMALALTRPRFDAEAIERIRDAIISELRQNLVEPNAMARRAFFAELFPDHPYGREVMGDLDSVPKLTAADLHDFVHRHLTRDHLLVAVAGDITPNELGLALDRLFGGLPATGDPLHVPEAVPQNGGKTKVIPHSIGQSIILMGQAGVKRSDPDWFPAYIMNYVLGGGGFSSRLTEEVREKRGLSYGVYSALSSYDHAALIVCSNATVNAKAELAMEITKAEWARMADGITAKELEDAKTYLTGSFPLQFSSTTAIAHIVLQVQHDQLGIDYLQRREALINAVTREDVQRVARRLLHADQLTTVVVGQPELKEAR